MNPPHDSDHNCRAYDQLPETHTIPNVMGARINRQVPESEWTKRKMPPIERDMILVDFDSTSVEPAQAVGNMRRQHRQVDITVKTYCSHVHRLYEKTRKSCC